MAQTKSICKAKNKTGGPCRAAATETGYCYLHSNPERASEIGRAGGRKNRHVPEGAARTLPALDNIEGVKKAIGQMIVDVHERRLDPKTVAGVAPLLNTLLRALGASELEQRISELEKQIEELHVVSSPNRERTQGANDDECAPN